MRNSVLTSSWSSPASYEPSYPAYEHGRGFYFYFPIESTDTDDKG